MTNPNRPPLNPDDIDTTRGANVPPDYSEVYDVDVPASEFDDGGYVYDPDGLDNDRGYVDGGDGFDYDTEVAKANGRPTPAEQFNPTIGNQETGQPSPRPGLRERFDKFTGRDEQGIATKAAKDEENQRQQELADEENLLIRERTINQFIDRYTDRDGGTDRLILEQRARRSEYAKMLAQRSGRTVSVRTGTKLQLKKVAEDYAIATDARHRLKVESYGLTEPQDRREVALALLLGVGTAADTNDKRVMQSDGAKGEVGLLSEEVARQRLIEAGVKNEAGEDIAPQGALNKIANKWAEWSQQGWKGRGKKLLSGIAAGAVVAAGVATAGLATAGLAGGVVAFGAGGAATLGAGTLAARVGRATATAHINKRSETIVRADADSNKLADDIRARHQIQPEATDDEGQQNTPQSRRAAAMSKIKEGYRQIRSNETVNDNSAVDSTLLTEQFNAWANNKVRGNRARTAVAVGATVIAGTIGADLANEILFNGDSDVIDTAANADSIGHAYRSADNFFGGILPGDGTVSAASLEDRDNSPINRRVFGSPTAERNDDYVAPDRQIGNADGDTTAGIDAKNKADTNDGSGSSAGERAADEADADARSNATLKANATELSVKDGGNISEAFNDAPGDFEQNWNEMTAAAEAGVKDGTIRVVYPQAGNPDLFYYEAQVNGQWTSDNEAVLEELTRYTKGKYKLAA